MSDAPAPRRSRPRTWLRRTVLAVLLLLALAHLGGGWYFSGQIESGALKVEPWRSEAVNTVTAFGGDTITIRSGGDAGQDVSLTSDGVFGASWDGGYGQISGRPTSSGGDVTRFFTLVQGESPTVGDKIAVDLFAIPSEPLPDGAQALTYDAPGGPTDAVLVPGDGDVWAIFVHGKGGAIAEGYRAFETTVPLGMPSLSIGYRNDVDQPADETARYAFGVTEWEDLAAAVDHARAEGAAGVVLIGSSMGGAIVASYLRHESDHAFVRGVVLDSPALDLRATIEYGAEQTGLSPPASLTWVAMRMATLRYGLDWDGADYLTDTSWLDVPAQVWHGTDDEIVPVATSRHLADRVPEVDYVELPDTGHVRAWNTDPHAFDTRLRAFLEPLLSDASRG